MFRLLTACLLGIGLGLFLPIGIDISLSLSLLLPVLLFSVGLSMGSINLVGLIKNNKRYLLLPLFSVIGSCVFSFLFAVLLGTDIKETLLAGGAMGFYSLPAIMVSAKLGAMAGTLVLITNMLREAFVIVLAPILLKLFGKRSLIAVGGATTMDVSLAMIKEVSGDEYVPMAILNGLLLTVGVPFVVSIFIN